MLTREIHQSLDCHTILYTTLIQLSNVLFLDNCAICKSDEFNSTMNLMHELERRDLVSITVHDLELVDILQDCWKMDSLKFGREILRLEDGWPEMDMLLLDRLRFRCISICFFRRRCTARRPSSSVLLHNSDKEPTSARPAVRRRRVERPRAKRGLRMRMEGDLAGTTITTTTTSDCAKTGLQRRRFCFVIYSITICLSELGIQKSKLRSPGMKTESSNPPCVQPAFVVH